MEEPETPTGLTRHSWWGAAKRTVSRFRSENLTDAAAALTYYGVLSIFPMLVVLVSIVGLAGESVTRTLIDNVQELAPGPASEIVTNAIKEIANSPGSAGVALVLGLGAALWSASGYVGAFARAANRLYEVEEGRPFWKLRPLQIALTAGLVLMLAASAIAVVVTGPLARQVGDVLGAGDTAVTVWDIAKWPLIALVVILMVAVLYYAAPNVRQPGFRWITPGSVLAIRVQLQRLQRDLRESGGRDHLPHLALALEPRDPARGRPQRRARAKPRARGRRAARPHDCARAPAGAGHGGLAPRPGP
jgi:membrane protein